MKAIIPFLLLLSGCAYFKPKSIGLDIELAGKAPTAHEAKAWRKSQDWQKVDGGWVNGPPRVSEDGRDKRPVLINGNPVDKAKYPAVINIRSASGASCTASIVGPQAILTAAHCAETGEKVSFKTADGNSYTAVMIHFEGYPKTDLDLNLGKVNKLISGVKPLTVRTDRFEKKGLVVDLIGYGCTQPGGSGGNDGVLRKGSAKVVGGQDFDLVLDASPSALCYGDSGGPVLFEGQQIGVNSKGNIKDVSYTTRTTLEDSKAWLSKTASALGVLVCGISGPCDGTEPPPGPKTFSFENDVVKLSGIVK